MSVPARIFAIGDLHLSGYLPKPMEKFGDHWVGHWDAIRADWQARVAPQDLVLIPGDISWAMRLDQAMVDLDEIGEMPGQKVLLRGNHDYWWSSIGKVRDALRPGLFAVQNDALPLCGWAVCGSRGWTHVSSPAEAPEDAKIYAREVQRLELSLSAAARLGLPIVAMMHFPPFNERREDSPMTQLFEDYGVKAVVYGHLHGASLRQAFTGVRGGIPYFCVSCDGLGFRLLEVGTSIEGRTEEAVEET